MTHLHVYKNKKGSKSFSKKALISNLSNYLKVNPDSIDVVKSKNGKPSVDGINFSISHCKHIVVQVFTHSGHIGVDVEYINNNRNYLKLAQRYFHKKESRHLKKLTDSDSAKLFYNLWTAKEAVCKAEGGRLWYYLADNYLTHNDKMKTTIKGLKLLSFDTVPNYALTVAMPDNSHQMEIINEE